MKKKIANWGNYPVIDTEEKTFANEGEAGSYIRSRRNIIARGNGRCYGDASLAPYTLSTLKYDKALSFDAENGIFECQAGMKLDEILEVIVPKGWFLPVTPGTKFITVGGAVASDVHGKNHHLDGSFSNHVKEMDILLASGELVSCSPEDKKDLFDATCGGMGLTGVITTVKFKLKKIETAYIKQKQIKANNLEDVLNLFEQYKDYTYSVAWIDCLKKGSNFGRSILILGEHANMDELSAKQKEDALNLPKKKQITFPISLPSFALNKFTVKAFNALYYSKNLKRELNNVVPYEPFFYPLDAVLHWNRGYGKKGFLQYQFVLPLESKEGLIKILKRISDKGLGSFLAVLKVFGEQDSLISFPMKGYTLALDFPVRPSLFPFLNELDQIVAEYNGRLYLSKDARMQAETLWETYPHIDKFKKIVDYYNPNQIFSSLQSERLLLTHLSKEY